MKKRVILLLLLLTIIIAFKNELLESPTGSVVDEQIQQRMENGKTQIYFCPRDNCSKQLYNFIDSAQTSIHCALFDLDLPEIIELLEQKSKQIEVKIITDDDNYANIEHLNTKSIQGTGQPGFDSNSLELANEAERSDSSPSGVADDEQSEDRSHEWVNFEQNKVIVKHDNRSALMHNKFCIIDNSKIFTGSFNPTKNGAYKNNNNMLIINSKYLSNNYETEFQEMWQGTFGKGNKTKNPKVLLNNNRYETYFCPEDHCADILKQEIKKANKSIYFTAFSFTHDEIGTQLLIKHHEEIHIKGVFASFNRCYVRKSEIFLPKKAKNNICF